MKRYQVKDGFSVHGERGHLYGPDSVPEDWLPADHLAGLIEAGLVIEVIEEPPATAAAIAEESRQSAGRKGRA